MMTLVAINWGVGLLVALCVAGMIADGVFADKRTTAARMGVIFLSFGLAACMVVLAFVLALMIRDLWREAFPRTEKVDVPEAKVMRL